MRPKILTTTIKDKCPLWGEQTEVLPGWREEVSRTWLKRQKAPWLRDLSWAWKLFRASHRYDAVVTGYEQPSVLFGLMQRLARRKRVPHVYLYLYPNLPSGRIRRWLKKLIFRAIMQEARAVVVFSRVQIRLYSQAFGIPESRFVCIPYYSTLWNAQYETSLGDYIFAGGDYTRDYRSLIEAVAPLPYRLVIAAFYRSYFEGIQIPPNVEILTTTHEGFLKLTAGAGVVVVPLRGGLLHPGGEQTYLNAMALGKAVVITDDVSAGQYIENGVSGVVLRPGDVQGLRREISAFMENRSLAQAVGDAAKVAAGRFSPDQFFAQLLAVIEACVNGQPSA
ncbi:MAG TPA: glycosyltransferase family 4 protein [Terriglobia bacterium]|nr:glycosyltransferase family 4 protein [Terriglobia bacterium]